MYVDYRCVSYCGDEDCAKCMIHGILGSSGCSSCDDRVDCADPKEKIEEAEKKWRK